MEFEEKEEFKKDFKRLRAKYRSLDSDFEKYKRILEARPGATPPLSYEINGLGYKQEIKIIKQKKFSCASLAGCGGNTRIRIIYGYLKEQERIEFIEIYFKGDKENEDRERINKYYE
jgi:hypothetical protein